MSGRTEQGTRKATNRVSPRWGSVGGVEKEACEDGW